MSHATFWNGTFSIFQHFPLLSPVPYCLISHVCHLLFSFSLRQGVSAKLKELSSSKLAGHRAHPASPGSWGYWYPCATMTNCKLFWGGRVSVGCSCLYTRHLPTHSWCSLWETVMFSFHFKLKGSL